MTNTGPWPVKDGPLVRRPYVTQPPEDPPETVPGICKLKRVSQESEDWSQEAGQNPHIFYTPKWFPPFVFILPLFNTQCHFCRQLYLALLGSFPSALWSYESLSSDTTLSGQNQLVFSKPCVWMHDSSAMGTYLQLLEGNEQQQQCQEKRCKDNCRLKEIETTINIHMHIPF